MEDHPQYAQTVADIEARGYRVVLTQDAPCVVVREVVDTLGNILRTEREVQVWPGMPYLDLEHEIGHLNQIENQLKGAMRPTERVLESGRLSSLREELYEDWMDDISEYHNRLVEYMRLYQRGVDADVLEAHAQGVRDGRDAYQKIERKARYRSSQASERLKWGQKHFPDIVTLEADYRAVGGYENERDLR